VLNIGLPHFPNLGVDGLAGDAECVADLLPGPALASSKGHLIRLHLIRRHLLGQSAQGENCAQTRCWVL